MEGGEDIRLIATEHDNEIRHIATEHDNERHDFDDDMYFTFTITIASARKFRKTTRKPYFSPKIYGCFRRHKLGLFYDFAIQKYIQRFSAKSKKFGSVANSDGICMGLLVDVPEAKYCAEACKGMQSNIIKIPS